MMAVMTVQPPLPLVPEDARPVGAAAAIVEDEDGGRVFVHGNLAYAWDAGDTAGRRLAAVSLVRIKAAIQLEVAEAFGVKPATVRRWDAWLAASGVAGLLGERKGPKRKSKLTADMVAAIRRLRDGGASYRAVAAEVGVSQGSVRAALVLADADGDAEDPCAPAGSDGFLQPEPVSGWGSVSGQQSDCSATTSVAVTASVAVQAPVLADPVDRGAERVLARFGLIEAAPPVFTPCARAPVAGLLLGLDRAPEVKTIRRKIALLAEAGKAGDWITAMARRRVQACPEQAAVCYVDGHVRAYQGTRRIAKTHVPRLKFPAPATVETWISDAAGDPLLVVLAEPAASLASELRRLIPELRAMV